jgi:hypothetical protein
MPLAILSSWSVDAMEKHHPTTHERLPPQQIGARHKLTFSHNTSKQTGRLSPDRFVLSDGRFMSER